MVWNGDKIFRLEGDVFDSEEENTNITVAGDTYHAVDGVVGMALSPIRSFDGTRYLFFRPYTSRSLYAANTSILKNGYDGASIEYIRGIDVLPSQSASQVFTTTGILFYGLSRQLAIGCWSMDSPLQPQYFVRNFVF